MKRRAPLGFVMLAVACGFDWDVQEKSTNTGGTAGASAAGGHGGSGAQGGAGGSPSSGGTGGVPPAGASGAGGAMCDLAVACELQACDTFVDCAGVPCCAPSQECHPSGFCVSKQCWSSGSTTVTCEPSPCTAQTCEVLGAGKCCDAANVCASGC